MVKFDLINNINEREIIMSEERLDVLDKVKELVMLKGTEYMTLEQVSNYYNVPKHTIETIKSRNKEELESNGMKLYSRNDIKNLIGQKDAKLEITIPNRGMILFSKRAILNIALLLKDNVIADKIKQELGISSSWNINLRKEIKFKNELDLSIEKIRQIMIDNIGSLPHTKIYSEIKQAIINLTTYKQQYNVCNNKYRIDYYFPLLNIAVEYDENYHNSKEQIEKDKQREYEIQRYFYINKNYKDVTEDDLKEWECDSLEELYDDEYNYSCDFYSFDLTKFIRIKEKNELEGLLELTTTLLYFSEDEIKARGMSCNYKDLLILPTIEKEQQII